MMTTSWSYVLLFLLMLMGVIIANDTDDWVSKCNRCRCHWKSAKRTADCKDTGQHNIPTDLHTDIQLLDLSNNNIAGEFFILTWFFIERLFLKPANSVFFQFLLISPDTQLRTNAIFFSSTQKSKRSNCPTIIFTISTSS
jgi:hypothetical protein